MLIASRALLGVAGATVAPSTLSLIRNMFHDPGQRTFAIGVWITSFSAGGVIGPVVGGVLLEYFRWGAVFLAAVPVMALLLLGPARALWVGADEQSHAITRAFDRPPEAVFGTRIAADETAKLVCTSLPNPVLTP